jgi:hypothetical protein
VKTTVEIPDALFREAKATAAREGISLKDFFTEAVAKKLGKNKSRVSSQPAWTAAFGELKSLHKENKRIDTTISTEFETIDEEEWR